MEGDGLTFISEDGGDEDDGLTLQDPLNPQSNGEVEALQCS